jgi:hypothetical protein
LPHCCHVSRLVIIWSDDASVIEVRHRLGRMTNGGEEGIVGVLIEDEAKP